jgi:hypothetical protein
VRRRRRCPTVSPATVATLAAGGYLDAGDQIMLLGHSGTGKTHLLIELDIAVCEQARRVRYATCVQLDTRDAELLFQVLTEREEKSSIGLASNLPFRWMGRDHR